jgi:(5-formylfuran-3-yl)methyl phosphate synthase
MRLLVSVRGPVEARAAVAGGADVIDAKDPARGALGVVRADRLAAIRRAVGSTRPVSAALGDARDDATVAAAAAAASGLAFLKLGFGGVTSEARAVCLARAARRGAPAATAVVLVAYADWRRAVSLAGDRLLAVAAETGAAGLLLDTAGKDAPLFALESPDAVAAWVTAVHAAGLFAALAGSLSGGDFVTARAVGADLVGVRGAACVGGRTGRVSRVRVAALQRLVRPAPALPLGVLP